MVPVPGMSEVTRGRSNQAQLPAYLLLVVISPGALEQQKKKKIVGGDVMSLVKHVCEVEFDKRICSHF